MATVPLPQRQTLPSDDFLFPTSVSVADFNGDGIADLVSADSFRNTLSVRLGNTTSTSLNTIGGISLLTRGDALTAQGQIDTLLDNVSRVSGAIGSSMSRLQVALQSTASAVEVTKAAESRITDADVAEESANLVRTQILQQVTTAILAQANQQPALVLQLLKP